MTAEETEFDPSDYDLTLTRSLDAPCDRVWAAWTGPEKIAQWWGPEGFTVPRCETGVRPGGKCRLLMTSPDGEEYPNLVVDEGIEEFEPPAYTHGSPDDPEQFRVMVTFEDEASGRTRLAMRTTFPSVDEHNAAEEFGAIEGGDADFGPPCRAPRERRSDLT